jgi:hypothetical protein
MFTRELIEEPNAAYSELHSLAETVSVRTRTQLRWNVRQTLRLDGMHQGARDE